MVYVYRRAGSNSARDLVEAMTLNTRRVKRAETLDIIRAGSNLVCWGEAGPARSDLRMLNGVPLRTKFADAEALAAAGVPTIAVSRQPPSTRIAPPDPAIRAMEVARELAEEFIQTRMNRSRPFQVGLEELQAALGTLNVAVGRPAPVAVQETWLGRLNSHISGDDLLNPPARPDFYVRKETLVNEYRIHSFRGQSIRGGIRRPQDAPSVAHPWIRSMTAGWRISYDGESITDAIRAIAHRAVAALGLQFGAVDIGQRADGSLIVLECNRAPGLDGGTITAYANAIERWVREV